MTIKAEAKSWAAMAATAATKWVHLMKLLGFSHAEFT
jgi:hypothetical protein